MMDDLLTPEPNTVASSLREDIWAQTTHQLHRTRQLQKLRRWGVASLCFLGGVGAGASVLHPEPPSVEHRVIVRVEVPVPADPATPAVLVQNPAEMEKAAKGTVAKAEAAKLYREAGNHYLRDYFDHTAALRCYKRFLDLAAPGELQTTSDDTWLLTSLKRDRSQELSQ
jgi:hypothetical protein